MATHYEQRKEANERYLSKMDEIRIRMPKESGLKEAIQAHAEARGESVNAFIIRAISQAIEQDNSGFNPLRTYEERKKIVDETSYLGSSQSKEFKHRCTRQDKKGAD